MGRWVMNPDKERATGDNGGRNLRAGGPARRAPGGPDHGRQRGKIQASGVRVQGFHWQRFVLCCSIKHFSSRSASV